MRSMTLGKMILVVILSWAACAVSDMENPMRSMTLGKMILVVILSWAACAVSEVAGAAEPADVQAVRQKAEQGDATAQQLNLGWMYYNGSGVP